MKRGFLSLRAVLRRIHLALGVALAVPLTVLGLSGSVLAVAGNGMGNAPPAYAASAKAHPPRSMDAVVRAAVRHAPAGYRLAQCRLGRRGAPMQITLLSTRGAEPLTMWIDAGALRVLGITARSHGALATVHALHETFLAGRNGRMAVGIVGVAMIVLGTTGPILWWPGRRRLREGFVVRRSAGAFRSFRDVHRAVGIWTVGFFLVVSITGTFIVFPAPIGGSIASILPARAIWDDGALMRRSHRGGEKPSLDAAVATARAAAGGGTLRQLTFARAGEPLRIDISHSARGSRPETVTVLLDPRSNRILDVRDPSRYSLGERVISTLRPLHEGQVLGPGWRAILAVTGLLPAFFAITGIWMWLLRNRRAAAAERYPSAMPTFSR